MVVPSAGQIRKPDGEKLDVSVLLDEPLLKEPVVAFTDTPKPEEQWTRRELVFSATGFLCCHIIGLPALIMSIFSYVDFSQKNYQQSLRKRKSAERLAIAAILTGGLFLGLIITFWRFCPVARPRHYPERLIIPGNAPNWHARPENADNGYWNRRIQFGTGIGHELFRPYENGARRPDIGHRPTLHRRPIFENKPHQLPQDLPAASYPSPFLRPPKNVQIEVQFGRKLVPFGDKKDDKPQAP